ncbi:hypothetical protein T12_5605 [Trichinella patagoniensis]|uniref:Uncharacterized protein n=1 Tax=Trichinella patagoniensis TaxID=990121 RepID=A0A0V1A769_9BILA|nr:hypothetical protein T12_5605 [Trichinella patagoniensis]
MKIILIAKSPIKGYKVADKSEQGKDPNNTHTSRYKRVEYVQFLNLHLLVELNRSNINHSSLSKSKGKQPIWNSLETAPGWLNFDIGNVFCNIVRP